MSDMNRKLSTDLTDAIMSRVSDNAQQQKAWKRKEKSIVFIYSGAILFALLILFFVAGRQAVSPKAQLPNLAEFKPGKQDLMVYYMLFTGSLVFSLIAFGIYFILSRRSRNPDDMFSPG